MNERKNDDIQQKECTARLGYVTRMKTHRECWRDSRTTTEAYEKLRERYLSGASEDKPENGRSLNNVVTAVQWELRRLGQAPMCTAQIEELRLLGNGLTNMGEEAPERGAIDLGMMLQVVRHIGLKKATHWEHDQAAVAFCWASAMRAEQMGDARRRNLVEGPDGWMEMCMTKHHDPKASQRGRKLVTTKVHQVV